MSEHTPGPWHVLGPWPSIHVGPMVDPGSSGEPCPEPPTYGPVCTIHQSEDYKTEASDEVKANAHLIAAAPDMLAALKKIAEYKCDPRLLTTIRLRDVAAKAIEQLERTDK